MSYYPRDHHGRSHIGQSHHSWLTHIRSQEAEVDKGVRNLKEEYKKMVLPIKTEDVHTTIEKLLSNTNLPFTNRLMSFPLPNNFKVPWMNNYDGRRNPTAYIDSLQAHPFLRSIPDEIACRIFPLTLKGEACEWFNSLDSESINDFSTLERQFLSQFLAIQKRKQHPTSLFSLVQRKTKSLEDFMKRFG